MTKSRNCIFFKIFVIFFTITIRIVIKITKILYTLKHTLTNGDM